MENLCYKATCKVFLLITCPLLSQAFGTNPQSNNFRPNDLQSLTKKQMLRAKQQFQEMEDLETREEKNRRGGRILFDWESVKIWSKEEEYTWDFGQGFDPYNETGYLYAPSNEYYSPYSQAYRMLGGYIDCDNPKQQDKKHRSGAEQNNNKSSSSKGCSRWMMWAAYVNEHYDSSTSYRRDLANYAVKDTSSATLNCGEPGSNWKLLGVYRQELYQFYEQISKHLWSINDARYITALAGLSYMTKYDCRQVGKDSKGNYLYAGPRPLLGGYMAMGIYTDDYCVTLDTNGYTYDDFDTQTSFYLNCDTNSKYAYSCSGLVDDDYYYYNYGYKTDYNNRELSSVKVYTVKSTSVSSASANSGSSGSSSSSYSHITSSSSSSSSSYSHITSSSSSSTNGNSYSAVKNSASYNDVQNYYGDDFYGSTSEKDDSESTFYYASQNSVSYSSSSTLDYKLTSLGRAIDLWYDAQEYTMYNFNVVYQAYLSCTPCMDYPTYQDGFFNGNTGYQESDLINQCWKFYSHSSYTCNGKCQNFGLKQGTVLASLSSVTYSNNTDSTSSGSSTNQARTQYKTSSSSSTQYQSRSSGSYYQTNRQKPVRTVLDTVGRDNFLANIYIYASTILLLFSVAMYNFVGGSTNYLKHDLLEQPLADIEEDDDENRATNVVLRSRLKQVVIANAPTQHMGISPKDDTTLSMYQWLKSSRKKMLT